MILMITRTAWHVVAWTTDQLLLLLYGPVIVVVPLCCDVM